MREREDTDFFASGRLQNPSGDPRARKVRAGRVGGYRDYLDDADEAFIDARVSDGGDPFAEYYAAVQ
jgi:hypothetical protein